MPKTKHVPADLLTRGVNQIIVRAELEKKLRSGKKLRIKHGIDPTTDTLHLGYAVVYWKLREFQELGHSIVFLIGDFTARFGDPTDKQASRQLRSKAEVDRAARHYLDQVGHILDLDKTEIRRNSEWYDTMRAEELLSLASNFSVAQMLERDMFVERQRQGTEIGLHEPFYPVLQGYDSVMLKSDVTVVGSDQLFNELTARTLQERAGQAPQDVLTMSLLIGTDGNRKMSQSLGNAIGLTEPAANQFGKVMRIPDNLIEHYFELATRLSATDRGALVSALKSGTLTPRAAKLRLAKEIVALYHGDKLATDVEADFVRVFSKKQLPETIPEHATDHPARRLDELLLDLDLASSKTVAQRLIGAGAVKIDGAVMGDWQAEIALHDGIVIQVGKRHFRKIRRT